MQSVASTPTLSAPQVHLAIRGMTCGHCVAAVTEALKQLSGVDVQHVAVGTASIALDPQATSTAAVVAAIQDAGYDARVADRPLPQIVGPTCCSPRPI